MTLKDHKQVGEIVCDYTIRFRKLVLKYSDCALSAPTDSIRKEYVTRFKAALLVYGALEDLCNEYDFDLTYEGDFNYE